MLESQPSYLDLRLCVYFILSCVLFQKQGGFGVQTHASFGVGLLVPPASL